MPDPDLDVTPGLRRPTSAPRVRRPRQPNQRGATMIEFAIVVPVLFAILFGIIDFGWAFAQYLDVRNGAREGARLVMVDAEPDSGNVTTNCQELQNMIRARMPDSTSSKINVAITYAPAVFGTGGLPGSTGVPVTITVTYPTTSLTGVTRSLIGGTMSSTVVMRNEQPINYSQTAPTGSGYQTQVCQ